MSTGVSVALWTRKCLRHLAFASIIICGDRLYPTLWRSSHEEEWTGGLTEERDYTRMHSSIRSEDKTNATLWSVYWPETYPLWHRTIPTLIWVSPCSQSSAPTPIISAYMAVDHSCCIPWDWPFLASISSSVRTILPHPTKKSHSCHCRLVCPLRACTQNWHAVEILYESPALCGKSFCPAQHNSRLCLVCIPHTTKSDPETSQWLL